MHLAKPIFRALIKLCFLNKYMYLNGCRSYIFSLMVQPCSNDPYINDAQDISVDIRSINPKTQCKNQGKIAEWRNMAKISIKSMVFRVVNMNGDDYECHRTFHEGDVNRTEIKKWQKMTISSDVPPWVRVQGKVGWNRVMRENDQV